jgi:hypothetical protein
VIKPLLIIIAILIYLWIGYNLFQAAVKALGGRMRYVNEIARDNPKVDPWIVYFWAGFLVMMFWPYYLLEVVFNRRK